MTKKEKKPMPKGKEFSKEYQPDPKAKSKGLKEYWKDKKHYKNARQEIYQALLKQLGFTEEGESNLHIKIAEKMANQLKYDDKDSVETFLKLFKEMQPEKPKETTLKGDVDNPIAVNLTNITTQELEKLLKESE